MTKYYCDRCGKEITSRSCVMSVIVSFHSDKNFSKDSTFTYELCPECAFALRHWVEDPADIVRKYSVRRVVKEKKDD